jgi:hypothetical protein
MHSDLRNHEGGDRQPSISHHPALKPAEPTHDCLQLDCDATTILLALQSNWRGYFIRIIVDEGGRYESIIVPLSLVGEFRQCVESVTKGGPLPKGMVESEGRTIYVRLEQYDLLLGERHATRNVALCIPAPAVNDFKMMIDELMSVAARLPNRRGLAEITLYSQKFLAGPKTVQVLLKENSLGRFLRVAAGDGLRFTSVLIPVEHLEEFKRLVDEAVSVSRQTPGGQTPKDQGV